MYYARAARKLWEQLTDENDFETAESLKERARTLLTRGLPMARHDQCLVEKLRRELDALDMENRGPSSNYNSHGASFSDVANSSTFVNTSALANMSNLTLTPMPSRGEYSKGRFLVKNHFFLIFFFVHL